VLAQPLAPLSAVAQTAAGLFTADSVRAVRAHGGMVVSESALELEARIDYRAQPVRRQVFVPFIRWLTRG